MRLAGYQGILFWCTVVLSLQGWLESTATAADLSRRRLSLYSWRWACTEEKAAECAKTGQTCTEPTGECECELPKKMKDGRCTVCTREKEEDCDEFGMTCDELTGACVCDSPKRMENGTCIDPRYPETRWFQKTTGRTRAEISTVTKPTEEQSSHKAEHTTAENRTPGTATVATIIWRRPQEWQRSSETTGKTAAPDTSGTTSDPRYPETRWFQKTTGRTRAEISTVTKPTEEQSSHKAEHTTAENRTPGTATVATIIWRRPQEWQRSSETTGKTAAPDTSGTTSEATSIGSETREWKRSTESDHETAASEATGTTSGTYRLWPLSQWLLSDEEKCVRMSNCG
ncbi:uncharacterized protein LOC144158794 isoform X2 [Haemaphysalis longicornis]